jgi:hypothetical protein
VISATIEPKNEQFSSFGVLKGFSDFAKKLLK